MPLNNNELALVIEETIKDSGEVIHLLPTLRQTIQPKVLLRLGVFVPTLKSTEKGGRRSHSIDATESLSRLSIVEGEGYNQIQIYGPRLDMDTDFKVWVGIVYALSNKKLSHDGQLELNFPEFAKYCGIESKRIDRQLKDRFDASLTRIARTNISFVKQIPGTDDHITINMHLVESTYYDSSTGTIIIKPNSKLNTLYRVDGKTRLYLKSLQKLSRKESAQALYLYLAELPATFYRIGFDRLRERLQLTSHLGNQNATVKKALQQLKDIGFLEYSVEKENGDYVLNILKRNPKL
ncbi:TPA: replication initiation protein [Salmonella enterica]|nr:replication initiation protein [Salmonella enterica subsp. enterica serovar Bovismorbificans]EIU5772769.1 replication initiation protein [Salmonella enterica]NYA57899.1 replication initiation protein [Salmonella enterica]HCL5273599.1 replication initiation protein [Salmonella enterica]